MENLEDREKRIIRVSIAGIAVNAALAAFKLFAGLVSHSIAITIDAVNNAGDVLSSVVAVIGTKIAGTPPDREHPCGHGRVEYLSAAVISAIILYAGVGAFAESVRKFIYPVTPDYTAPALLTVAASIAAKLLLGRYTSRAGERLRSEALRSSGQDSLWDAAISASTLTAAGIFMLFGLNLEALLGLLISLAIIRAGIKMFRENTSKILGERADSALSSAVKDTIRETPGVSSACDLFLSSYGPDRFIGSVNIEVPDTWTADKIDAVSRDISRRVAHRHGVILAAVGIHSNNSPDPAAREMRERITEAVMEEKYVLQLHGFYCDTRKKTIRFDIVIDFAAPDSKAVCREVIKKAQSLCPGYRISVQPDSDYSD